MIKLIGLRSNLPIDLNSVKINWISYKVARKESTCGLKTFITKWITGDTATGRVVVQR